MEYDYTFERTILKVLLPLKAVFFTFYTQKDVSGNKIKSFK